MPGEYSGAAFIHVNAYFGDRSVEISSTLLTASPRLRVGYVSILGFGLRGCELRNFPPVPPVNHKCGVGHQLSTTVDRAVDRRLFSGSLRFLCGLIRPTASTFGTTVIASVV